MARHEEALITEAVILGGITLPSGALARRLINGTSATNIYNDINFVLTTLKNNGTTVQDSGPSGFGTALELDVGEFFTVNPQMPHEWIAGTTVFPHLHIMPQTDVEFTIGWKTSYSIADIGGVFPLGTIDAATETVIPAGSQWKHLLINLPAAGIDMSAFAGTSTVLQLKHELDSCTGGTAADAHIIGYDVHYRWGGSPVPYISA